jgi:hypothetical protein
MPQNAKLHRQKHMVNAKLATDPHGHTQTVFISLDDFVHGKSRSSAGIGSLRDVTGVVESSYREAIDNFCSAKVGRTKC